MCDNWVNSVCQVKGQWRFTPVQLLIQKSPLVENYIVIQTYYIKTTVKTFMPMYNPSTSIIQPTTQCRWTRQGYISISNHLIRASSNMSMIAGGKYESLTNSWDKSTIYMSWGYLKFFLRFQGNTYKELCKIRNCNWVLGETGYLYWDLREITKKKTTEN